MRILSIELKNIRSYEDQIIRLPEGSTLLSGDIGCGKTTILLAIEFALFGIVKGVSGMGLLRHGEKEGSVELKALVQGNELVIHRSLKKTKSSVAQQSGYLIYAGLREELTATELKAKVLSILGYPEAVQSKSLIYRYTVYTPQEEMKQILYESSDDRLNTIRKIFNIDKYKLIHENSALIIREMKQEKLLLGSKLEDYAKLSSEHERKCKQHAEEDMRAKSIQEKLKTARQELDKADSQVLELEEQVKAQDHLKSRVEMAEMRLKEERVFEVEELPEKPVLLPPCTQQIKEKKEGIREKEQRLEKIQEKQGRLLAMQEHTSNLVEKIKGLDNCPMCKQTVGEEHKQTIASEEGSKIAKIEENLTRLKEMKQETVKSLDKFKEELSELQKKDREADLSRLKLKNYEEKLALVERRKKEKREFEERRERLASELKDLKKQLNPGIAEQYKQRKTEQQQAREGLHRHEIEETRIRTEIRNLEAAIETLKHDLESLERIKQRIGRMDKMIEWMHHFQQLMGGIEKQILMKVYTEFNSFFKEWFDTLIEDDSLCVKLGQDFSPVIEQNGYETTLEYLSGGEKTSVALAYRLALFKIINDFVNTIKTRDIIILDEPTDGFSSEQLDRVRDVLVQLDTKQTIIVSHEQKMESFVDNTLRIEKEGHVSRVYT